MTFLDKLNLRPQERRLIVLVAVVIFIVLNFLFVKPHFGEWKATENKIRQVTATLDIFQKETARMPNYKIRLATLQTNGSDVLTEELALQRTVQSQASSHGLMVTRYDPRARGSEMRTNQFFGEQALSIDFTSGGKELVDFLVDIAAGNSMIRVREMNVKPDPTQTKLMGNITLIASYQKKAATNKPAAIAPKTKIQAPAKKKK
jgi:Tfp pilus assembly protein PilO